MKKMFTRILSVLSAVAVVISAFSVGVFAAKPVKTENWMSAIGDKTPITAINMSGTHDSATQFVTAGPIARTQSLSIYDQLKIGVRYLDIRLEKTDNDFIAVHGIADCKVDDGVFAKNLTAGKIIEYCSKFLKENPTETILFQLKEDDGEAGLSFFTAFYDMYIKNNTDLWYTENRIPTMGEVRGKIVLLRVVGADTTVFNDKNSGINFNTYPYIGNQEQYDYRRCDINKLDGTKYASMYVQDSYKLEGDKKWTAIKDFLDSDLNANDFNICLTSCTNRSTPKTNAKDINKRFMDYKLEKGRTYGIIVNDFIDEALCEKTILSNAGVVLAQDSGGANASDDATSPTAKADDKKPTQPKKDNVTDGYDKNEDVPKKDNDSEIVDDIADDTDDIEAPVDDNQEEFFETENDEIEPEADENSEKMSTGTVIACVVAGVIVLGGAGAGLYFFIKKRQ